MNIKKISGWFLFVVLSLVWSWFLVNETPPFQPSLTEDHQVYAGYSWGELYSVRSDVGSEFYLDKESEYSVYRVLTGTVLMCYSEISDRVFCWYMFEKDVEPISGWVDLKTIHIVE